MTQEHPITPPPELVQQLWGQCPADSDHLLNQFATLMARWGADQELEACCEWLKAKEWIHHEFSDELRATRRPKPPSLKEQALEALETEDDSMPLMSLKRAERFALIRRALESLPD